MTRGFKALLMGPPGTGKTYSISTLLDAGLKVRCVFMDQKYSSATRDPRLKEWKYLAPATGDWSEILSAASTINKMTNDAMQKLPGINKQKYTQFIDLVTLMNNFVDEDGRSYGDVKDWGTDTVLVLDPLTGLNQMSRNLCAGAKPILSQPDWGVAMENLGRFVDTLCMNLTCHFVLIAHVEREVDEVSGGVKVMVSTLGRKLAPTFPAKFTDVILSYRQGSEFFWSTINPQADLIGFHLPLSDKLPPSFKPVLEGWKARGGVIQAGAAAAILR